ncbi:hypothetical protein F5883DRAFT_654888 [Diaporthe sp. PMI_573]|nr:hypothetical protein F5883DRAFT_654888 [Diaporthaceae sp. PMI_573]
MAQQRQKDRDFLRDELRQMRLDIITHIEKRMEEHIQQLQGELGFPNVCSKDELDEEIERVQDYTDRLIDVKLDDRIDGVKIELQEYVEDQLEQAEERLLDRLKTASLILDIADE